MQTKKIFDAEVLIYLASRSSLKEQKQYLKKYYLRISRIEYKYTQIENIQLEPELG